MKKHLYSIIGAIFLLCSVATTVKSEVAESTDTVMIPFITKVTSTETVKVEPENPYENKYTKLADELNPTVVYIEVSLMLYNIFTEQMEEARISGSGVFISETGHVLTCSHLFTNPNIKWVSITTHDKQTVLVDVLYLDHRKDLALLRPWYEMEDVKYTKVVRRPEPKVGEEVIAIGYPFGLGMNFTNGIITSTVLQIKKDQDVFWTNAVINGGNSGGPLFDMTGKLLGINVMIITPSWFGSWAGNSFSVTNEEINDFLDKFRGF
jgi:S1-C subfamily serine protease